MVNFFYALILSISCNVFKDFEAKKNVQRVLVSNLVAISKDLLFFSILLLLLEVTETRNVQFCMNKHVVRSVRATQASEHCQF